MNSKYIKECLVCGNDIPIYKQYCNKKCAHEALFRQLNSKNNEKLKEKNEHAKKRAYFNR